jgi:hypothetical protein
MLQKPGKIGKVPNALSERSDCRQFESTCFVRGVCGVAFQRKRPAAIGVKAPFPGFVEPALATSIEKVPSGDRWIHEIKFDGYRVQVHLVNEAVKVFTRRGNDWTKRFRKVADDAWHISAGSAIVDGEIVVPARFTVLGKPRASKQHALRDFKPGDTIERLSPGKPNADGLALPPDNFAIFCSSRVGNQSDLEPAWQNVAYSDNEFCTGLRQIAQAAFIVRQTVGRDPRRLVASPPNLTCEMCASQPVHTQG